MHLLDLDGDKDNDILTSKDAELFDKLSKDGFSRHWFDTSIPDQYEAFVKLQNEAKMKVLEIRIINHGSSVYCFVKYSDPATWRIDVNGKE